MNLKFTGSYDGIVTSVRDLTATLRRFAPTSLLIGHSAIGAVGDVNRGHLALIFELLSFAAKKK